MAGRLDGKLAVITGGSRGIGLEIARAFVREGAVVVITGRKAPGLEAAADQLNAEVPGAAFYKTCHAGSVEQIQALYDWIDADLGTPGVLINNAATNPYMGPMLGATEAAWDKTFDVNLKGTFEMSRQLALRLFKAGQGGSIVNLSSIFGMRAAPLQGLYGMSKAAMISLTKTLAVEWGPARIRVNAIAPGLVETRFAAAIVSDEVLRSRFTERAALGRHATPDEIAGIALHLASEESTFTTGQTFVVDGGYTSA